MAAGQGPEPGRAARPGARLAGRGRAGRSACCCTRTCPRAPRRCWRRSGRPTTALRGGRVRRQAGSGARVADARAAVPQANVIDSHTHLHLCEPPRRRAGRRRPRGRRHPDRHRRDRRRRAAARRSPPPSASRRCTPRSAATPTRRPASTTPTSPSSRRWPPTSGAWRSARPGWTTTASTRRRGSAPRLPGPDRARPRPGKPLVIHTRAADDDTLDAPERARRRPRR